MSLAKYKFMTLFDVLDGSQSIMALREKTTQRQTI